MTRLPRIVFCDIDGVLNSNRYLAKKMPSGPTIDDDETWSGCSTMSPCDGSRASSW